jgi:hypothetical protein
VKRGTSRLRWSFVEAELLWVGTWHIQDIRGSCDLLWWGIANRWGIGSLAQDDCGSVGAALWRMGGC